MPRLLVFESRVQDPLLSSNSELFLASPQKNIAPLCSRVQDQATIPLGG